MPDQYPLAGFCSLLALDFTFMPSWMPTGGFRMMMSPGLRPARTSTVAPLSRSRSRWRSRATPS